MSKAYWKLLKDPRWQKKRLEIMEENSFACQRCGDKKNTLNVHHFAYKRGRKPWAYTDLDLFCLCEKCHELFHRYKETIDSELSAFTACCGIEATLEAIKEICEDIYPPEKR